MKRNKSEPEFKMINLRFLIEDIERFKILSKQQGLPMAALIRIAAKIGLDEIEEDQNAITKSISSR